MNARENKIHSSAKSFQNLYMQENYLNISNSRDLKIKKEKILYRILEALPGSLVWLTIILTVLLSWLSPAKVAVFIIIFDLFWMLRISYLSFHQISGYKKMKENIKIDWLEKLKNSENQNWKKIFHLVILPIYKEELDTLRLTLQSLSDSDYPKDKIMIVLATEERAGNQAQITAEKIKEKFGENFFRFLITIHPENIPGEINGKGSNFAFAFKEAKEKLIKGLLISPENIIVSNFDSDTRPYPQYFGCLTWHFLDTKEPLKTSFQPIPIYNNNIWEAPSFSRTVAVSGTFWQMMQQERQEQLINYSSHAVPFKVLDEVGYPANVVSDDSRIFWKSFLFYDGKYRVKPLHYPVSMDAVLAKNLKKTAINQYKQQRRWAWLE